MALVADEPSFHDATLLNAVPTMIWITGPEQQARFFNHAWLEFTGQTLAVARQAGWAAGIHPDDATRCLQTYQTAYATQQPFELEYRRHHASGEYCWHLDRATPHCAVDGTWLGYIGTAIDITDRKLAEAALHTSEEKFAKAFNASPLVITISQLADGHLVEVNDTFVQLTGYTRAEVLGRTPVELRLWVEPAQRAAGLGPLQAGHALRNEVARFRLKDGQVRTCLVAAERIDLNGQPCVLTVLTDITDREAADVALRENEARFRAIFEQAAVGIAQIGPESRYLRVNERLCEITGYPRDALLQKTYQEITYPDDLATNVALANRLFAGELPSYTIEKRYRRPDGAVVWVNITASAVSDAQGTVKYQIAVIEDISARKLAEARLRFLAETSAVLASSLDYAVTLQRIAELMVPQLADLCTVELLDGQGGITPVAVVHVNPAKQAWAQALRQQYPRGWTTRLALGTCSRPAARLFIRRFAKRGSWRSHPMPPIVGSCSRSGSSPC